MHLSDASVIGEQWAERIREMKNTKNLYNETKKAPTRGDLKRNDGVNFFFVICFVLFLIMNHHPS